MAARTNPDTIMTDIPPPEVVALARQLYAVGEPVDSILAQTELSAGTLYKCLAGRYDDGRGVKPQPMALRRSGIRIRRPGGGRAALVARLWSAAEKQVQDIEQRAMAAGLELGERESNARMLAVVARTLRELVAVDRAKEPRGKPAAKEDHDESPPRNVDDLRRELAKKIQEFAAREDQCAAGEPE